MVFYSPMDLISQLMDYEKALGLEFDGKMIDDCIVEVQENCPHIYTNQELKSMCKENLARIQEEYGFRGLRVWYHSARKNLMLKDLCRDEDGWGGDDMIERKYYRLIPHIWEYHNKNLMFSTDYFLNVMLYYKMLEDVFKETYGSLLEMDIIDHECNELYHMMKTVHLAHYDVDVVKALLPTIQLYLEGYNCKYYLSLDLTGEENLQELYLHLAEENYDEDAYGGFTIFHSNDGWGNTVFDKWETIHNDDGSVSSRLIRPNRSVEDFDKKGSVYL